MRGNREKRVLIMTSVSAERDAILRGLGGSDRFVAKVAGVGSPAAAASAMAALMTGDYDVVVNAGIAGGFSEQAPVGSIVVADEIVAADLGAETEEGGFSDLEQLGFGSIRIEPQKELVDLVANALQNVGRPVKKGSILTVSTATGSKERADQLAAREPGAVAEAMEGYGVAIAAKQLGVPMLEVRTISNVVGPRRRDEWRVDEALEGLTIAAAVLKEVLV